ncbi:MAG: hypothetical protein JW800_08405, partial [Candidatus Omnitrophica bacterium]|nr:hypothetical protein [Candidatus Omnitrophota bacterium]
MKKDFSPEERLLRLIKGVKKKDETEVRVPTRPEENSEGFNRVKEFSLIERMKSANRFKAISISMPVQFRKFDLHTLNYIFVVILLAILSFFIYDLFYAAYYKPYEPKIKLMDDKK